MPRPSATTWLLVLLVLVPTGALAILGFQAADAYDAADASRLRTELQSGREQLEASCAREAALLRADLQALVDREAAFVAAHPGEDAVAAVSARLRAEGLPVEHVRLVSAAGVGLWPVEFVPSEAGKPADLAPTGASLLHYLRREADRAYYGGGGLEAAEKIWETAQGRFHAPSLKRLAQVEAQRLRVRAGRVHPVEALETLHGQWEEQPSESAELGRPYLLLRLAAAQAKGAAHQALVADVLAGRTARIPLTAEERSRLRGLAHRGSERADRMLPGQVGFEAEVAYGARLVVRLNPMTVRKRFGERLKNQALDPLFCMVAEHDAAQQPVQMPAGHGMESFDVAVVGGVRALVVYGHNEYSEVMKGSRKRRWLLGAVVLLLVAATLLGLGLTRRAVARERAARRMRDEFIANVTHEVRTPLTSVLLHSEILAADEQAADRQADAKRREHAEVVRAQGKRLAQLVDDMLDFSALERGTRTLESVPVDLGAACREAVAPYRVLAGREGVQVRCEIFDEEVPAMGDPAALARVLANLLGNAWKHGRPARDGTSGRITIRAFENEVGAHVEVRDNGPGIPAAEREQIFARFGRGRRAIQKEGAGIGLSLSRDLARAMGGELVAFEDGGETVFQLMLDPVPELEMDA